MDVIEGASGERPLSRSARSDQGFGPCGDGGPLPTLLRPAFGMGPTAWDAVVDTMHKVSIRAPVKGATSDLVVVR